MSKIERITDPMTGPPDCVYADIKCQITSKVSESVMPCHVFCAYSEGTMMLSVRDIDLMMIVRLDEIMEILHEASLASKDMYDSLPNEYTTKPD